MFTPKIWGRFYSHFEGRIFCLIGLAGSTTNWKTPFEKNKKKLATPLFWMTPENLVTHVNWVCVKIRNVAVWPKDRAWRVMEWWECKKYHICFRFPLCCLSNLFLDISNDLKVDYTTILCSSSCGVCHSKDSKSEEKELAIRLEREKEEEMEDLKQILGRKVGRRQLDMIEMYQLRIYCNWSSLTWEKFACNQKDMLELMWYTVQSIYMFSCFFSRSCFFGTHRIRI